mmetsp:Transcript_24812/g.68387  ORF Transcript_24812/g.68387 Transcript_24812/m.68387 type:complete len:317 (+) Transcript_24812:390-1340(+)
MKLSLQTCIFASLAAGYAIADVLDERLRGEFVVWAKQHAKTYETDEETNLRLGIWKDNNAFIDAHNSQEPSPSYTLGHNHFSDLTLDEYQEYNKLGSYSPGLMTPPRLRSFELETTATKLRKKRRLQDIPDSVDWVEKGAIVPVKNQGMCGSCWAFSAIVAIEGAHYLDTGDLISLSEQELVDCDKLDMGCGGGLMDNAFLFDEDSTGICSEDDYPYAMHRRWIRGCGSENGECVPVEHTRVQTFTDVENTVDGLLEAIAQQPVSVAMYVVRTRHDTTGVLVSFGSIPLRVCVRVCSRVCVRAFEPRRDRLTTFVC